MDLLFINTSIADQVQYDDKMVDIQLAIAEYSEECRNMFFEYVCVSNFPQCDPSHSSPRPNLVCISVFYLEISISSVFILKNTDELFSIIMF